MRLVAYFCSVGFSHCVWVCVPLFVKPHSHTYKDSTLAFPRHNLNDFVTPGIWLAFSFFFKSNKQQQKRINFIPCWVPSIRVAFYARRRKLCVCIPRRFRILYSTRAKRKKRKTNFGLVSFASRVFYFAIYFFLVISFHFFLSVPTSSLSVCMCVCVVRGKSNSHSAVFLQSRERVLPLPVLRLSSVCVIWEEGGRALPRPFCLRDGWLLAGGGTVATLVSLSSHRRVVVVVTFDSFNYERLLDNTKAATTVPTAEYWTTGTNDRIAGNEQLETIGLFDVVEIATNSVNIQRCRHLAPKTLREEEE